MQAYKRKVLLALALISIFLVGISLGAVLYSKHFDFTFKVKKGMGLELWNESKTLRVDTISWGDFDPLETKTQTFYVKNIGNTGANVTATLGSYDTLAWSISMTWVDETIAKKSFSVGTLVLSITEVNAVGDLVYGCDLTLDIVDHFSEPVTLSFGTTTATYEAATATYLVLQASGTDQTTYGLGEAGTFWYETKNIKTTETLVAWQDSIQILKDGSLCSTVQSPTTHTVNLAPLATANLSVAFTAPSTTGNYAFRIVYHLADSVVANLPNNLKIQWWENDLHYYRGGNEMTSIYSYGFPELNVGEHYDSDGITVENDGTIMNPQAIAFDRLYLPSGYTFSVFFDGQPWAMYDFKYVTVGAPRTITFTITNVSGDIGADFSNFIIRFYHG